MGRTSVSPSVPRRVRFQLRERGEQLHARQVGLGEVRVRYQLDGTVNVQNSGPYPIGFTPTVGTHVLTAMPYGQSNAQGLGGVPLTVRFTVQP